MCRVLGPISVSVRTLLEVLANGCDCQIIKAQTLLRHYECLHCVYNEPSIRATALVDQCLQEQVTRLNPSNGHSVRFLDHPRHSYGYRGKDCRNNLYLLPTGEMVYFVAGVVVLYNVDDQMQRHYTGHTDDVKWCVIM